MLLFIHKYVASESCLKLVPLLCEHKACQIKEEKLPSRIIAIWWTIFNQGKNRDPDNEHINEKHKHNNNNT